MLEVNDLSLIFCVAAAIIIICIILFGLKFLLKLALALLLAILITILLGAAVILYLIITGKISLILMHYGVW